MRALIVVALVAAAGVDSAAAQPPGKWPPDSLVNVQVIPKTTQPVQVWGMMRNIAGALGVSCTFCHVGSDSAPLERIDFATDEKRNKRVARQMMRMVQEVNTRLDTIPSRPTPTVTVTCITCHRGVNRPVPLASIIVDAATAAGADSAIRTYRALRDRYYGRDAYDFGEVSLNTAAFRTARAGKINDALELLRLNEQFYPNTATLSIVRGNIALMHADTAAAAAAFREAIRRDPKNDEAHGRLRDIHQTLNMRVR
jgi:Photosynthetic reaction centre cytochrome C subunit